MSEIKVDTIGPRVDNGTLTIGAAGDTVNIAGTAGTGFPAGTTINTNADNRVITGSGTAGTLNGEANMTFDGTTLTVSGAGSKANLGLEDTASSIAGIPFYSSNQSIYTHDVSATDSTAEENTAYGIGAMDAITTGDRNTAIGRTAGGALSTGANNVFMGKSAGGISATGDNNTAVGYRALASLIGGNSNTAFGYEAGVSATGSGNTFVGYLAGEDTNTGINNVMIGHESGKDVTSGNNSIFIGHQAGQNVDNNSDGSIFIGYQACQGTGGTVYSNVYIGKQAGGSNDANSNTIVGNQAGDAMDGTACTTNTLMGDNAGGAITSGAANTFIGSGAGTTNTSGYENVSIGKNANQAASGSIGHFTLGPASITSLRCQQQTISTLSDERDKTDITDLPDSSGLDFINSLKPRTFHWDKREWYENNTPDGSKKKTKFAPWKVSSGKQMGFVAQEVQSSIGSIDHMNRIILSDNPDKLELAQDFIPSLVKAVQQLSEENNSLKSRLSALENV